MSRIGIQEIKLPAGLSVKITEEEVQVKGSKGQLTAPLFPGLEVVQEEDTIKVTRNDESKKVRALHGLCRSLINNAVIGVSTGFKKDLEILGVGYRATPKGKDVEFALGYSHPILFDVPEGITVTVEKNTLLTVEGIDKQKVGQIAANIRSLRPPEPYKGKGIRYKGEFVIRKVGKAAGGK